MNDILQSLLSWPLLLVALAAYGFFPGLFARLISLSFRKGDPRRAELIAEVYVVPRWERPFWVLEQLERALSEGAWERIYDAADGRLFNRWMLGDGVARNAESPDTFWIPTDEEIATIEEGDVVKLMFEVTGPTHDFPGSGERMWVTVTRVRGDTYEGTLSNQPAMFGHLRYGDRVKFSRKHIIDYDYRDDNDEASGDSPGIG